MKKLAFTIAALAAFSFANAQTELQPANQTKKVSADQKEGAATTPKKNGPVVENGALSTTGTGTASAEPKKSGTRMAINEKGLPGEKKPANATKAATNSNPK